VQTSSISFAGVNSEAPKSAFHDDSIKKTNPKQLRFELYACIESEIISGMYFVYFIHICPCWSRNISMLKYMYQTLTRQDETRQLWLMLG